jgi:hypothetical protein
MAKIVKRQLEMEALITRDLNGIEMGVLSDGTAFLTGRGLAAICGVAPSVVNEWANDFDPDATRGRDAAIARLIAARNYQGDLFVKTKVPGQGAVNAYPEAVCTAVIEYYAFEAAIPGRETPDRNIALKNYRILAHAGLRAFVYTSLGYDPQRLISDPFRSYHDRLLLNTMPPGWFSVFSESAHIVLASIQAGLIVDSHTVPDGSVGQFWSKYWVDNDLASQYGERSKHPHVYPPDYPQSQVTPDVYVYPIEALGVFRKWLVEVYLPEKYPAYLQRKVKLGALPASRAELLVDTLVPKQIAS